MNEVDKCWSQGGVALALVVVLLAAFCFGCAPQMMPHGCQCNTPPSCLECHPSGCGCDNWQPHWRSTIGKIGAAEPTPDANTDKAEGIGAPCNPPPRGVAADRLMEKKTGQWRCLCCNAAFVGPHMHTTYTAEGDAITFLCTRCWSVNSPAKRAEFLDRYLLTQPGAPAERLRQAVQCDQ